VNPFSDKSFCDIIPFTVTQDQHCEDDMEPTSEDQTRRETPPHTPTAGGGGGGVPRPQEAAGPILFPTRTPVGTPTMNKDPVGTPTMNKDPAGTPTMNKDPVGTPTTTLERPLVIQTWIPLLDLAKQSS
jgi:hypothetical protein